MLTVIPAEAQFIPVKAKANFVAAQSAVRAQYPDAVLNSIACNSATAGGVSVFWLFEFYSAARDSVYGVSVTPLGSTVIPLMRGDSSVASSTVGNASWVDSDVAFATGQANGGSAFQGAHSNATVDMVLMRSPSTVPLLGNRLLWTLRYLAPKDTLFLIVDAATEQFVSLPSAVHEGSLAAERCSVSAYPNPSNRETSLAVELSASAPTTIQIIDGGGREIFRMNAGMISPGRHSVPIDPRKWAPGMYRFVVSTPYSTSTGTICRVR